MKFIEKYIDYIVEINEYLPISSLKEKLYTHLSFLFLKRIDCIIKNKNNPPELDIKKIKNKSGLDFSGLKKTPEKLIPNLEIYIDGFKKEIKLILKSLNFYQYLSELSDGDLFTIYSKYNGFDLSLDNVSIQEMDNIFFFLMRKYSHDLSEVEVDQYIPNGVYQLLIEVLLSKEKKSVKNLKKSEEVSFYYCNCGFGSSYSEIKKNLKKHLILI